jgi:MFS family permease
MSIPAADSDSIHNEIDKSANHNLTIGLAQTFLWGIGESTNMFYAMVPAYMLAIGSSKTLTQIMTVSFTSLTFLQLFGSWLGSGRARLKKCSLWWTMFGIVWICYGTASYFFWDSLPVHAWMVIFMANCYLILFIMHLGVPSWTGIIVENIPKQKRGKMAGIRSLGIGGGGLLGALLIVPYLKSLPSPSNFHLGFVIGGCLFIASALSMQLFKDKAALMPNIRKSTRVFATGKILASNFNFRVFMIFMAMLVVAQNLTPMIIAYGKDAFSYQPYELAYFTFSFYLGTIALGSLLPVLADRFGFRLIAILYAFIYFLVFLLLILFPGNRLAPFFAYGLFGGNWMIGGAVFPNLGSELAENVKPAKIVAVGATMLMPASLVIAPLAGKMVDVYGTESYLAVFVAGVILSACAAIGFMLVLPEPRSGRELYIRIRQM